MVQLDIGNTRIDERLNVDKSKKRALVTFVFRILVSDRMRPVPGPFLE